MWKVEERGGATAPMLHESYRRRGGVPKSISRCLSSTLWKVERAGNLWMEWSMADSICEKLAGEIVPQC